MSSGDRLGALDAAFLDLERGGAHMHVAGVFVFAGHAPDYEQVVEAILARLHLVPRYRQKLASVPLFQARPEWVDDPHFNVRYHVRHSALPAPGGDEQLERLAARLFAQPLDRAKPLWEMNLVEGLAPARDGDERFAIVFKTHHALVDGISAVDLTSVLFGASPTARRAPPPGWPWVARPEPSAAQLVGRALIERASLPGAALGGLRRVARAPGQALAGAGRDLAGVGAFALAGLQPAPGSPLNVRIGPHRRYTWVEAELDELKAIKNALGGTINDVVLAAVTLALGGWMRARGHATDGVVLRALVPVSVRGEGERGALGNRVAAMYAPLPLGLEDPREVLATIRAATAEVKESGQAVGMRTLTQLAEFAPPTLLSQAARLQARQRFFNLVVTNVPGPQTPLYLLGRELLALHPVVPLARNLALGVAAASYMGRMSFGLLGDYDAIHDLRDVALALEAALAQLSAAAAGARRGPARPRAPRARPATRAAR